MNKIFQDIELFFFDLDGVIYEGNTIINGALDLLQELKNKNLIIYALTNNSTLTREMYHENLEKMGINIPIDNIMTSGYATALYLSEKNARGKSVFVIGEIGLMIELQRVGINPFNKDNTSILPDKVDYVIVGLDRNFHYQKLANALRYVLNGAIFIASNDDPTLPSDQGPLPGAGTMVSSLSTCSHQKPTIIIGKPNPFSIHHVLKIEHIPPDRSIIIGDRYTTDISAGINAKIKTILVRTGVGKMEEKIARNSKIKPDLIVDSVADLLNMI